MAGVRPAGAPGEALGYAAVFLPEIAGRDALVALGELAGEMRLAGEIADGSR